VLAFSRIEEGLAQLWKSTQEIPACGCGRVPKSPRKHTPGSSSGMSDCSDEGATPYVADASLENSATTFLDLNRIERSKGTTLEKTAPGNQFPFRVRQLPGAPSTHVSAREEPAQVD